MDEGGGGAGVELGIPCLAVNVSFNVDSAGTYKTFKFLLK